MSRRMENKGQTTLEFAFSVIILMLMIYSTVMIFSWTGRDLISRTKGHDSQLTTPIDQDFMNKEDGPLKQIAPYFHYPEKMKAVWGQ